MLSGGQLSKHPPVVEVLRNSRLNTPFLFDPQCIARAETQQCLKFAVRLWSSSIKECQQIVVEVQRTAGCCFLYQETAKAILRAAKNGSGSTTGPTFCSSRKSLPMPKCLPQIPDSVWEECTRDDLDNACSLLKPGNRLDAHMLAAESLVQLSEASKCRAFCAKAILSPKCELLSTLVSLVQCPRVKDHEGDKIFSMEETHFQLMHRHALSILANCLGVLQESGELTDFLADLPELTNISTIQALMNDLQLAQTQPHDAAAACRCLQALCRGSDQCKNALIHMGAKPMAMAAKHLCRHAVLESEASKLMQDL